MFKYLILLGLTHQVFANETRIKIAIIDTGVDYKTSQEPYMCEYGNVIMDP